MFVLPCDFKKAVLIYTCEEYDSKSRIWCFDSIHFNVRICIELIEPHQKGVGGFEDSIHASICDVSPSTLGLSQVSAASAGLLSDTSHSLHRTSVPLLLLFVSVSSRGVLFFFICT